MEALPFHVCIMCDVKLAVENDPSSQKRFMRCDICSYDICKGCIKDSNEMLTKIKEDKDDKKQYCDWSKT